MDEEGQVITPIGVTLSTDKRNIVPLASLMKTRKGTLWKQTWSIRSVLVSPVWEPVTRATNFDIDLKQILDRGSDTVFVADSIAQLASKTGINLQGLLRTLEEYNKACETAVTKF